MLNKITLILVFASFLSLVLGVSLANREIIPATTGLGLFALAGLIGMIAAVFAVIVLFKQQYVIGMIGIMGLMPLIIVAAILMAGLEFPAINDVSTNLADIPQFTHAQTLPANANRDMAFPVEFIPHIEKSYSDLTTLEHTLETETIFLRLKGSLSQILPRTEITHFDQAQGIIEGVTITRTFRWRDDFVIHIRPNGSGGTLVDMRSKSRDGRSDFGANAKRIQTVFDALKAMS